MSDPKIRVSADLSDVESAAQRVGQALDDMAAPRELQLDFDQALDDAAQLGRVLDDAAEARQASLDIGPAVDAAEKVGQALDSATAPREVQLDASAAQKEAEAAAGRVAKALDEATAERKVKVDTKNAVDAVNDLSEASRKITKPEQGGGPAKPLEAAGKAAGDMAGQIDRVRRAQEILAREGHKFSRERVAQARAEFDSWRGSGARGTRKLKGTEFDDWLGGAWRHAALNETDAKRERAAILKTIGIEAQGGPPAKVPAHIGLARLVFDATARGGTGHMVTGALRGPAVAAAAAEGGLLGAAGGPGLLAGGAIGLAALGAAKFVGKVFGEVGNMEGEAVGRGQLSRETGSLSSEFEALADKIKAASDGLGITRVEALKLAKTYATEAGKLDTAGLRRALETSRGTGVDPEATARFLATLQREGVAAPTGAQMVDATHGRMTALGEMMNGLRDLVGGITRSAHVRPDTAAVVQFAGSLASLKLPGLDAGQAMDVASRADAAYRNGGDPLKATMARRFRAIGGNLLSEYDMRPLMEAGLYTDLGQVFGPDSPAYKAAKTDAERARLQELSKKFSGRKSVDLLIDDIEANYGLRGDVAVNDALANALGMSQATAAATRAARSRRGVRSKFGALLNGSGIDPATINQTSLSEIQALAEADGVSLRRAAKDRAAQAGTSQAQREAIERAQEQGDEPLRQELARIAARNGTMNAGEKVAQSQADLTNMFQDFAARVVPLLTHIRDGVLWVAEKFGVVDKGFAARVRGEEARSALTRRLGAAGSDAERMQILSSTRAELAALPRDKRPTELLADVDRQMEALRAGGTAPVPVDTSQPARPAELPRVNTGIADQDMARRMLAPKPGDEEVKAAAAKHGVPEIVAMARWARESGARTSARDNTATLKSGKQVTAVGPFQIVPEMHNISAEEARQMGPAANKAMEFLHQLYKKYGNWRDAVRAYEGSGPAAEESVARIKEWLRYANEIRPGSVPDDVLRDFGIIGGDGKPTPSKTEQFRREGPRDLAKREVGATRPKRARQADGTSTASPSNPKQGPDLAASVLTGPGLDIPVPGVDSQTMYSRPRAAQPPGEPIKLQSEVTVRLVDADGRPRGEATATAYGYRGAKPAGR